MVRLLTTIRPPCHLGPVTLTTTHPETLVEEAVDDGVAEAVGHGHPVARDVDAEEDLLLEA